MTPGRRPQLEMRPPAEGRHRKVSTPAHTAPSGVAEALDRMLEAKRALRVQLGGSENLPPRPPLTSSPSANTLFRESLPARLPPMRARQADNPATAVRAKRHHAPPIKDAILSLLRGLTAEPIPADASGRHADIHDFVDRRKTAARRTLSPACFQ